MFAKYFVVALTVLQCSSHSENRPHVTNDGKYLFFTSTRSGNRDIYWMDAKIIKELKPAEATFLQLGASDTKKCLFLQESGHYPLYK